MSKKTQTPEVHHEELMNGLHDQTKVIMDSSEQPIFLYLNDNHKARSSRFAALLGYKSPRSGPKYPGFWNHMSPRRVGKQRVRFSYA